jgi:hypothetical protein
MIGGASRGGFVFVTSAHGGTIGRLVHNAEGAQFDSPGRSPGLWIPLNVFEPRRGKTPRARPLSARYDVGKRFACGSPGFGRMANLISMSS